MCWNHLKSKYKGIEQEEVDITEWHKKTVRHIKQIPAAFIIRYDKVSTAVLNVFPYMIHFTFDEANKTVIVSAEFHTSRDPELWKTR